jgi:hypothetical protein
MSVGSSWGMEIASAPSYRWLCSESTNIFSNERYCRTWDCTLSNAQRRLLGPTYTIIVYVLTLDVQPFACIKVSFIAVCTGESPISCLYLCIRHPQGASSPPTQDLPRILFSEPVRDKILGDHNRSLTQIQTRNLRITCAKTAVIAAPFYDY